MRTARGRTVRLGALYHQYLYRSAKENRQEKTTKLEKVPPPPRATRQPHRHRLHAHKKEGEDTWEREGTRVYVQVLCLKVVMDL